MAYFINPLTGKLEYRKDLPVDPLGFSAEQYAPRDRVVTPMGPIQEFPSVAVSEADRAVNRDPVAMQNAVDRATRDATRQESLDKEVDQELINQKAAEIRRQYAEESAVYDTQYDSWVKGGRIGNKPPAKPSLEQWLNEKEGGDWGVGKSILSSLDKISSAAPLILSKVGDVLPAYMDDRQAVGYQGRRSFADLENRKLVGMQENLQTEPVIAAQRASKDFFEAQSPRTQDILTGDYTPVTPEGVEKPIGAFITPEDKEAFAEDSGLRRDPSTWVRGIVGEANNALKEGKTLLIGARDTFTGDQDTEEAKAFQDFGYLSGEQALLTGGLSSGVVAGASALTRAARAGLVAKARQIQLLSKKALDAEKRAREARKLKKYTEAAGAEAEMVETGKAVKQLADAMRKESGALKAAMGGSEVVAKNVLEATTESATAGAQGAGSQAEFTGIIANAVQEALLDSPGLILDLPKLRKAAEGLGQRGVSKKDFLEKVLPKMLKDRPDLLEEASQHPRIKELGEAVRDINIPNNSVAISPQETVMISPDYSVPGTSAEVASASDALARKGVRLKVGSAEGYEAGASGSLLGETKDGKILLNRGATEGTVAEEAVHSLVNGIRSGEYVAGTQMLGTLHDHYAKVAEEKIRNLPATSRLKRELSEAFGRDITQSPLTGDELIARAITVGAGWKSASRAEDLLGKIVGLPTQFRKDMEAELGKFVKNRQTSQGLMDDYTIPLEQDETISDVNISRSNTVKPRSFDAFKPLEERPALRKAYAKELAAERVGDRETFSADRAPTPEEHQELIAAGNRVREAATKGDVLTELEYLEERIGPRMKRAGYDVNEPDQVDRYLEKYPDMDAMWYKELRDAHANAALPKELKGKRNPKALTAYRVSFMRDYMDKKDAKMKERDTDLEAFEARPGAKNIITGKPIQAPEEATVVNLPMPVQGRVQASLKSERPSQDTRKAALSPKTPKAKKAPKGKNAREEVISTIRGLLQKYGKISSTFDMSDAIDKLNQKNRLRFYSELDTFMDENRPLLREVGVDPVKGEGREDLIDKLKVWGNRKSRSSEEWGTFDILTNAEDAPFPLPEMVQYEAQDLVGEWYVAQDLIGIRPSKNPAYMDVFKNGERLGRVKKEDKLSVDRIQVKETEDMEYPEIPESAYVDENGGYDPIFSPIEAQEEIDYRTLGVGRMPAEQPKKVTVADLDPDAIMARVSRESVVGGPTGTPVYQPKKSPAPALRAELKPGDSFPGMRKAKTPGGKLAEFLGNLGSKIDKAMAQQFEAWEKLERENPSAVKTGRSGYLYIRRLPALVQNRLETEIDSVIEDIVKGLGSIGVTWDQAEQYAYAGAALERNEIFLKEKGVENASGMSDKDAIESMEAIANTPKKKEVLERLFGQIGGKKGTFQKINDAKLDAMVEAGLLPKESVAYLKDRYKFYLPLKDMEFTPPSTLAVARAHVLNVVANSAIKVFGEKKSLDLLKKRQEKVIEDSEAPVKPGQDEKKPFDMSVKAHNLRVASGRSTPADFPLSWAIRDAVSGIAQSERAKAQQMFLEFVQASGADSRFIEVKPGLEKVMLWTEKKTGKRVPLNMLEELGLAKTWVNERGDYRKEEAWVDPEGNEEIGYTVDADNEAVIAHNGRTYKLIAATDNPTAVRAIRAMKQSDVSKLGGVLRTMASFNNFRSALLTRYSPTFPFSNVPKDMEGAFTQTFIHFGVKSATNFVKSYPLAMTEAVRGKYGKGSKLYKDYKKHGGSIEFMDTKDAEGVFAEYSKKVNDIGRKGVDRVSPGKILDAVKTALSFVNGVTDQATRLAAYKAAVDAMPSYIKNDPAKVSEWKDKAALFSRDATVDFNAKGDKTPVVSSIWLFANPGIQQFRNVINNFKTGDADKTKRALVIYSTAALMGSALSLYNRSQGDDEETGNNAWDDVKPYSKSSKIILLAKQGASIAIPLMYGSAGYFFAFGVLLECILNSEKDTAADHMELGMKAFAAAMPAQELLPSLVVPFWETATNKNFADMPIVPEKLFESYETPESEKFYRSTPEFLKEAARGINKLTGGNREEKGGIDVSPELIQYWAGYFGGAVMNEGLRVVRFAKELDRTMGTDEEIESKNIPILSKWTLSKPVDRANRAVYEAENDLKIVRARLMRIARTEGEPAAEKYARENVTSIAMLRAWKKIGSLTSKARGARENDYIEKFTEAEEKEVQAKKLTLARNWNQFKKGAEAFNKAYSRANERQREILEGKLEASLLKGLE